MAYGASVQAAILGGEHNEEIDKMVLLDVTPLSLGIETNGAVVTHVVPRGTMIPAKKSQIFTTAQDSQTTVSI